MEGRCWTGNGPHEGTEPSKETLMTSPAPTRSSTHPLRALPFLVAMAASGCVVYGYPCKDGFGPDGQGSDGDTLVEQGDSGDGGDLLDDDNNVQDDGFEAPIDLTPLELEPIEEPEPPEFALDPSEVVQGEAVVATLLADDEDWDHTAIVDVTLGSGLVLCDLELTEEGASLTYGAWGDAELGEVDVTINLGDDVVVDVPGGILVVAPGGIVVPDPAVDPCTTLD